MKLFTHFNYVLFFYGRHYCPKSKSTKVFNFVLRFILLSYAIFNIINILILSKFKFSKINTLYNNLTVFYIIFERKLKFFFTKLNSLKISKQTVLMRLMKFCVFIFILLILLDFGVHVNFISGFYWNTKLQTIKNVAKITLLLYSKPISYFPELSILIYIYTFSIVFTIKRQFLSNLTIRDSNSLKLLYQEWLEIVELKYNFESTCSIYPLFKFIGTFIWTLSYIISFHRNEFHGWGKLDYILAVLLWVIPTGLNLILLYLIEHANECCQRFFLNFCKQYGLSNNVQVQLLLREIEKHLNFKLTAYGLFKLNSSLILSFGSALISFTILAVQLASDK